MTAPPFLARCFGWPTSSRAIKANEHDRCGPLRANKRLRRPRVAQRHRRSRRRDLALSLSRTRSGHLGFEPCPVSVTAAANPLLQRAYYWLELLGESLSLLLKTFWQPTANATEHAPQPAEPPHFALSIPASSTDSDTVRRNSSSGSL